QIIKEKIWSNKKVQTKACAIDLVTETDRQVEQLLISGLQSHFPDHMFIGEESTDSGVKAVLTDAPTWIIDPVDGTMNFVHGNPNVCVSVGLYVNKQAEVGIIYCPVYELMYTAMKGKGAQLNGKSIHVSEEKELAKALVCIEGGTSRDPEKIKTVIENFEILIPQMHGYRASGSAAFNLASVAQGCTDAFIEFGCHAWDMAAGELIVREAGGAVIDPSGGPFDVMSCRIICASSQELAQTLAGAVKQYYPKRDDAE
ncbi:hypothetical protein AAG570_012341, partial [Ranatra chinensis]